MKAKQAEPIGADEIQAEINRMENACACMEARAGRLEAEAQGLRNYAAIERNRIKRLKWLLQ